MKRILLLAMVIGLLVVNIAWADTLSVGPERFFLNGKEVPLGTAGAISGDQIARERLSNPEPSPLTDPNGCYYASGGRVYGRWSHSYSHGQGGRGR